MGNLRTNKWLPHEDEVLRNNLSMTAAQMVKDGMLPGRSVESIKARRAKIGISFLSAAWPAERLARLRHLVEVEKCSAREAAEILNATKNAVISMCRRAGIKFARGTYEAAARYHRQRIREKLAKRKQAMAAKAAQGVAAPPSQKRRFVLPCSNAPKPPTKPGLPPPLPMLKRPLVSIASLEHRQCKYIPGEVRNITIETPLYCGAPTDGGPWCEHHKAGVMTPLALREANALQRLARLGR